MMAFPLYHLLRALPSTFLARHSSLPAQPAIPLVASPGHTHPTCYGCRPSSTCPHVAMMLPCARGRQGKAGRGAPGKGARRASS